MNRVTKESVGVTPCLVIAAVFLFLVTGGFNLEIIGILFGIAAAVICIVLFFGMLHAFAIGRNLVGSLLAVLIVAIFYGTTL